MDGILTPDIQKQYLKTYMTQTVSDTVLSQFSEFVTARMGLYFPSERWRDLERGMGTATREFGHQDVESCIRWLVSSPLTRNQLETLASHLTVGETYFFREKRSFEILEEQILPELIRSRRGTGQHLRIWSAGCCTGEEPHSIAILLHKLIPDIVNWRISILATDINPRFLKKATDGIYTQWSFRDTPQWVTKRYFTKRQDGRFEILPDITKMVTFSYLNLAEDVYPSLVNNTNAMDLIMCRNVLMYFAPERAKNVIQHLHHSLIDGGWLIVSSSEASHVLFSQFVTANFPGAIFYRKDSKKPHADERFLSSWMSSSPMHEETKVSFQRPADVIVAPEREIAFSPDVTELFPTDVEERTTPEPERPPYEEAAAMYEQGRYEEAAEKLVGLCSHDDANPEAIILLSRTYANQGNLIEALVWCDKAITTDKLNRGGHYLRATILQEQGRLEEAVMSLKRALYLDQNFVLAHVTLGNLMLQQGKLKEAGRHFENALSLLSMYRQEDTLPESEGITAGRLLEIVTGYRSQVTRQEN